jgi:hypothetical protein
VKRHLVLLVAVATALATAVPSTAQEAEEVRAEFGALLPVERGEFDSYIVLMKAAPLVVTEGRDNLRTARAADRGREMREQHEAVMRDAGVSADKIMSEYVYALNGFAANVTYEEAVRLANDSEFGLGASVWTKDRAKGERISHEIESGMVWTNDHSFSHGACQCAWGGVKNSGLGRSHSKFGFYECVNVKQLTWEPGWTRDIWWQPYDRTLANAIRSSAQILYSRNGHRLKALREGFRPLVEVTRRTLRKGA